MSGSGDGLEGRVGFPVALASAVGLVVATATLVMLCQGFAIGGPVFVLSMFAAMIILVFEAVTFSELATAIPKAGSFNDYVSSAIGVWPATMAVISGYVLVNFFAGPAEASIAGMVISNVFIPSVPPLAIAIILVFALMTINLLGIEVYGASELIFTIIMVASLLVVGVAGLFGVGTDTATGPGLFPSTGLPWTAGFSLVALAIWLFIGVEYICPLAEEVKNPGRNLPLAMFLGLLIIFVVKTIFGLGMIRHVPLDQLASSATPHLLAGEGILGKAGLIWMAIVGLCATMSTLNTVMASVARLLYGMAREGQVPRIFGYLHPRYRVPWAGVMLTAVVFLGVLLTGITMVDQIVVLILAGSTCWFVAYILIDLSHIVLRLKYPGLHRPYKSPAFPVPQLLAIAALIYVLFNIHPDAAIRTTVYTYAGVILVLCGVYAALWSAVFRKRLFEPVPLEAILERGPDRSAATGAGD